MFLTFFLWVAFFVLSELLRPKPKVENARPAALGDFTFPTATEGRVVPIIWGTVKIDGPNVVWYGDLSNEAITKKIKTGLFSSSEQTLGYRYFIGIQFAFCRGPTNHLRRVWINEKEIFSGDETGGPISISEPELFGGDELGSGGVEGTLRFYRGTTTQAINDYLASAIDVDIDATQSFAADFGDGFDNTPLSFFGESQPIFSGTATSAVEGDVVFNVADNTYYRCILDPVLAFPPDPTYWAVEQANQKWKVLGLSFDFQTDSTHLRGIFDVSDFEISTSEGSVTGSDFSDTHGFFYLVDATRTRFRDQFVFTWAFQPKPAPEHALTGDQNDGRMGFAVLQRENDFTYFEDHLDGIVVFVNSISEIEVFIEGVGVTLNSPTDFDELDPDVLNELQLQLDGIHLKLYLNGDLIFNRHFDSIFDIPNNRTGIFMFMSAAANWYHYSGGFGDVEYPDVGIYSVNIDTVARAVVGEIPAYRGTSYAVWEAGYIGNSTSIQPWGFELTRIPVAPATVYGSTGGADGTVGGTALTEGYDINPVVAIYEILTNVEWGLGFPPGDIDEDNFGATTDELWEEDNGFSMVLDNPIECSDLLKELERQIDGVLYIDRSTGQWKIKLIRDDYDVMDVPAINESNLIEVQDFTRGAWEETTNHVLVQFSDREKRYNTTYAMAMDSANVRIQGNVTVSVTENYPGVKNRTTANRIAWRDLRRLSYPLAKAKFVCNRSVANLYPGDVVRWSDTALGITNMAMRITRIDLGKLDDGRVVLDVVQDIFTVDDSSFADPPNSLWVNPAGTPADIPVEERQIFEAPKAFDDRAEVSPGVQNRIWAGGLFQHDKSGKFEIWTDAGAGFVLAGESSSFMRAGKLSAGILASTTQGSTTLTVVADPSTQEQILRIAKEHTANDIGTQLYNLIRIDDEFIAFTSAEENGDDVDLTGCYRGLLDSAPSQHATDAVVFFLGSGGNITDIFYNSGDEVDVRLLTSGSSGGTLDLNTASTTTITMNDRAVRPYPPVRLTINSTLWDTTVDLDNQTGSTLDTRGLDLEFVRKDWRTTNEVTSVVSESLPADFPSANTTEYAVSVYDDPSGANTLLFTSSWNAGTDSLFASRTRILRYTSGSIPTTLGVHIRTRHTVDSVVYEALQTLDWPFSTSSALLSGDFNFGVIPVSTASAAYTAANTGTFTLNIGTALSTGAVEVELNASGIWTPVITATNTTGTFAATSGNTIKVRHTQTGSNAAETFLELVFGGVSKAYSILTY